jgi:transcriptional regulator with XRE-family HTH domain
MLRRMDHATIGRAIRVVRVRRRVRQRDLAALVDRSQPTISRLERGRLAGVTTDTLERVCSELGIRVTISLRWEGAELDRLLGARHSAMHDEVARLFGDLAGWVTVPEVTFAIYAERGVIDILAWHAPTRSLLVIELKTELVDVQETVGTLDRKRRLAAQIAAERGWRPLTVSSWLLVADGRTNRRRVQAHRSMLRTAFPADGRTMTSWLRSPVGSVDALSFLPSSRDTNAKREFAPVRRVNGRRASVGQGR